MARETAKSASAERQPPAGMCAGAQQNSPSVCARCCPRAGLQHLQLHQLACTHTTACMHTLVHLLRAVCSPTAPLSPRESGPTMWGTCCWSARRYRSSTSGAPSTGCVGEACTCICGHTHTHTCAHAFIIIESLQHQAPLSEGRVALRIPYYLSYCIHACKPASYPYACTHTYTVTHTGFHTHTHTPRATS